LRGRRERRWIEGKEGEGRERGREEGKKRRDGEGEIIFITVINIIISNVFLSYSSHSHSIVSATGQSWK
jgi:hypothetical protein